MSSVQSRVAKFWLRRQDLFTGDFDPLTARERMERLRMVRLPRGVEVTRVEADSVPSEWLVPPGAPPDRVMLYIHGGAWCLGSTNTHRGLVSGLARLSGIRAFAINYRLAPEHPYPAGLEDCLTAYRWLLRTGVAPQNIVVGGDSAGGNLTLALLVALRDAADPLPAGAFVLSPATDLAMTGPSVETCAELDPLFGKADPDSVPVIRDYIAGHDPCDPLISPLYADLRGLPPLLLHVGSDEILLDDTRRFGERATEAGVDVQTVVWSGMFHVFHAFGALLPEAREANHQIADFIRARLAVAQHAAPT